MDMLKRCSSLLLQLLLHPQLHDAVQLSHEEDSLRCEAIIFHLWKQRNNAYHNSCVVIPSVISKLIYRDVKNTILARRDRKKFCRLLSLWIL
ncbi:hypothetical protein BRARA_I03572 [Brassica rapa]|uniref:Secreted protein n=1 Tax=Brassica campestris TaxID=3711 RepID=A0A397Y140_BRACM|nr:hypothetical protein BRARA_I03572 [Brassica rapa]